jgi:serine/threonine protein kinase
MAPELLTSSIHNEKVDLWSIGVIAYFLLTGDVPFFGDDITGIKEAVKVGEYDMEEGFEGISTDAKDFIKKLLEKDVKKRLSAA